VLQCCSFCLRVFVSSQFTLSDIIWYKSPLNPRPVARFQRHIICVYNAEARNWTDGDRTNTRSSLPAVGRLRKPITGVRNGSGWVCSLHHHVHIAYRVYGRCGARNSQHAGQALILSGPIQKHGFAKENSAAIVTPGQPDWPWYESGNSYPIRFRAFECTKLYQTPPLLYGLMISDRTWRMFPLQLTRQYFVTALQLHWRQQSEKYGVVCWGKNRNRGSIELLWLTTLLRGMGRGRSIHLCATLVAGTVYTQYQGTGSVFGCLNIQMHRSLKAGSIR